MSRLERPTPKSSNPAKKFLEWKSEKECFSYYDREKSENIDVNLPIKFLFIEHYHTVKGWHDASESKIYSNEVYSIGSKELTVKSYKGGELAKGLYKNIKDKIKSFGGRYYRSIYVMLDDGELINIQLKGAAVKDYSDFYQEKNHLLDNQWIVIKDVKKEKKGRIEYTVPVFSLGDTITRAEDKKAMEVSRLMQNYVDSYNAKNIEVEDLIEVEKGDDSDPLDF
jgi:hypothetical protein